MEKGIDELAKTREEVDSMYLQDKSATFNTARIEALEMQNLFEVAEATAITANERKESRGAHAPHNNSPSASNSDLAAANVASIDLLLRAVFHSLVGVTGLVLLMLGVALLLKKDKQNERWRRPWLLSGVMAALVLILPPSPSFSDLASNRPQGLPDPPELAFVLPPEQRSLTEWVRLLRSQPDPDLVEGNPLRISGFVWRQPQGPPLIARLTVRCCLADATPAGLAVEWPESFIPQTNQWLAIEGTMSVQTRNDRRMPVVIPQNITPIARPERPLEP